MKLFHYSSSPIVDLTPIPIEQRTGRYGRDESDKPAGLWVSDDNEIENWYWWCISERYKVEDCRFKQEIILKKSANILFIRNEKQLDDFSDKYAVRYNEGGKKSKLPSICLLRWKQVCSEFDGIIITPYLWKRRLVYMWYYGWDCASGCIWNIDAIECLGEPIMTENLEENDE